MKKKIISSILAMSMALSLFIVMSAPAKAEDNVFYVNKDWNSESVLPEGKVWGVNAFNTIESAVTKAGTTPTNVMLLSDSEDDITVPSASNIALTLSNGEVKTYVKGTGNLNIIKNITIKASATGGSDNGGIKADGGALNVNVADGVTLMSNTIASGSGNIVNMTAKDATIHGTEYAEIFNAYNGGVIEINSEGAAQSLTIKSEENNNQGLTAYINATLKAYGLKRLEVIRTTANRGVNGVYASSGSDITINTAGDSLNTDITIKGGQADEDTGSNASAMALYSTWYTGSGDNKKFSTLNANGIKSISSEITGQYGQAFAVYETFGSTLNVNSSANTKAEGTIKATAEYYANSVVAAGGNVNIYGVKDISAIATGNDARSIKGTAIGVNAYGETYYSSPNCKANLRINADNADNDTSISAQSTSADWSKSWDAYAMGVYSYKEAESILNGIKDITAKAKGIAYGIYSYSTTEGKTNTIKIDMAGKLGAETSDDNGEACGLYGLYYSDITIDGNNTSEINAKATGNNSEAYGISAFYGATQTLNNIKSISADGKKDSYAIYASGANTIVNISGKDEDNKTDIKGDVSVEDGAILNMKNTTVTAANVDNTETITYDMTDETANKVKLIDYTGSGDPNYGTYEFAAGKDFDYILQVENNDLYAVRPDPKVTFDSNEGSSVADQTIEYNTCVTKPTNPTRSGYIFAGWSYKDDESKQFLFDTKIKKDTALIANWIKDYNEGKIDVETKDWGVKASSTIKKADIPMTTAEARAVENDGATIDVNLIVKAIEKEDTPEADKELVEESLEDNQSLGMYLDLSMSKVVTKTGEDPEISWIYETLNKIKVTITIPENLRANGRKYTIVRVHNGVAEKLVENQEADSNWQISFETDKFSTYALVYEGGTAITPSTKIDTGDHNNIVLYVAIGVLAIIGLIVTIMMKKRNAR